MAQNRPQARTHLRLCHRQEDPISDGSAQVAAHERPPAFAEPQSGAAKTPIGIQALFLAHAQFVAQVALRVLGRDDEVDDIVQEVFICALTELGKLHQPQAVRAWLKTITVRKAYKLLRRRRLRAFLGLDDPARRGTSAFEIPAPGCSPEEHALLLRAYRLLDKLPAAERLAWTLRYIDGEQVESVATLCGCSLATAKRRISAAHTFLERMLKDV